VVWGVGVVGARAEVLPPSGAQEGRGLAASSLRIERVETVGRPVREVRLRLSAKTDVTAKRLPAQDGAPERIYVDVIGAQVGPKVQRMLAGSGPVRQVRTGQRDTTTARVVVELAAETPFTIATKGTVATLRLGTQTPPAAKLASAVVAKSEARTERKTEPKPKADAKPEPQPVPQAAAAEPQPAVEPSAPPSTAPMMSTMPAPLAASPFQVVYGVRWIPPALDTALYADDACASLRDMLARWQTDGTAPDAPMPGVPGSAAAAHLAADALLVRAAMGQDDPLAAIAAYERAARDFPDFADAPRAQLMAGVMALWLELGPEASSSFGLFLDRFSGHALAPYARIAQATALRIRHRPKDAARALGAVLPSAAGDVRCEARLEEARQARDPAAPERAATLFRGLAIECPQTMTMPQVLRDHASALAAAGARGEARALLAAPRTSRGADEDAALDLLTGTLAQDDRDLNTARIAYERVLGRRASKTFITEAEMRLAVLDGPKRALDRIEKLAAEPGAPGVRASLLVEASRTELQAGHYQQALAVLDRATNVDPAIEGEADAQRALTFRTWVGNLAEVSDWTGIAVVYAGWSTQIHRLATADDRLVIAGAFERLGLPAVAADVMRVGVTSGDPSARIAYAEVALRDADVPGARAAVVKIEPRKLDPALAARLGRVRARIALADGDLQGAETGLAAYPDAALAEEVARAQIQAAETATSSGAWDDAIVMYRRVLGGTATGPTRTSAAAGLARVALARGDAALAAVALDEVTATGSPLARRIAAAIAPPVPAAERVSAPVDVPESSGGPQ
jgi:tetratricopeptide (TPR) repeat protein